MYQLQALFIINSYAFFLPLMEHDRLEGTVDFLLCFGFGFF